MSSSAHPSRARLWRARLMPLVWVALAAFLVRSFIVQPFSIPSGSMLPTLQIGDYLFVSKYNYGYSRFSLPLNLPLPHGRLFSSLPQRGDIIVFRHPADEKVDYIKRVIGVPGDVVQIRRGEVWLNGVPLARRKQGALLLRSALHPPMPVLRWRETLPGGLAYDTLDMVQNGLKDDTSAFHIPEDHLFVMGDNRDNSNDSRGNVGFVPMDHVVGRARIIYFSAGQGRFWQIWQWPERVRAGRIGTKLQ